MRRFDDAWVVDRTMFEYLNQGGCSCCGVTHQIMDVAAFAERCSDWESDDETQEQFSPWPPFIHEEILTERARLRLVMKDDMKRYKAFADSHMKGFASWWQEQSESSRLRIFQVSDDEIMGYFRIDAKVKGSYEIVLCAVLEQLRHFKDTQYQDGRTSHEMFMEKHLQNRHSCFTMDPSYINSKEGTANVFEMLRILGGPKLLPVRQTGDPQENNQAEEEVAKSVANVQSFRSDRRLLRLVIFRKFVDTAIRKYTRETAQAEDDAGNQIGTD